MRKGNLGGLQSIGVGTAMEGVEEGPEADQWTKKAKDLPVVR